MGLRGPLTERTMEILFLSAWFPCPPTNGSQSRIWSLVRVLAERHRVRLLAFRDPESDPSPPPELLEVCAGVESFPLPPFRPRSPRALAGLLGAEPRSVSARRSQAMARAIEREIARREPDLVIASELLMASYSGGFAGTPALLEGVELSWCAETTVERGASAAWRRWRRRLTRRKLEAWLGGLAPRFRLCTAVSADEAAALERAIAGACPVRVVPNAIDLRSLCRAAAAADPEPDTLVYPGAVTYDANLDAVRWFAREVWPRVLARRPGARLTVTGSTRGVDLRDLAAVPGVSFTGHLEDVHAEITRHSLVVVPLRRGGGTRVKILEAMALGVPVVATAKGAEGLDVEPGRELLLADGAEQMASSIVGLLESTELRERLRSAGRLFVGERHDWEEVGRRFLALVDEAAGPRSQPAGIVPPGATLEPRGRAGALVGPGLVLSAAALLGAISTPSHGAVAASPAVAWSSPVNLSRTETNSKRPAMTADALGRLHVVWVEDLGGRVVRPGEHGLGGNSVVYARNDAAGWSEAVDVVHVPGRGTVDHPLIVDGEAGRLHLFWAQHRRLLHRSAEIAEAGSARGWTLEVALTEALGSAMQTAAAAVGSEGALHVVHAASGANLGVWHLSSTDGGASWSRPTALFASRDPEEHSLSNVRLVLDGSGALHATWASNIRGGFGHSLYYARATAPYARWSEPWRYAERGEEQHGPRWPYLAAAPDGVLHLLHTPGGIVGRTYRTSSDGGLRWSEPRLVLTSLHGINGYVFPLWDGAGAMHLIANMRTAPEAVVGIYHASLTAEGFSDPTPADVSSPAAPSAHHAVGAVTAGERLHVVYVQNDIGEVWYLAGRVDSATASGTRRQPDAAVGSKSRESDE